MTKPTHHGMRTIERLASRILAGDHIRCALGSVRVTRVEDAPEPGHVRIHCVHPETGSPLGYFDRRERNPVKKVIST